VAVEIERDGSFQIGAVDACSRARQASENFDPRQAERTAESYRNDGELRLGRGD
jgi:hypothetical protein